MINNIYDIINMLFQQNGFDIVTWAQESIYNLDTLPQITPYQVFCALTVFSILVMLKKLGSLPISYGLIHTFILGFLGIDVESPLHPMLEQSFSSTILTILYFYLLSNNNYSDLGGFSFLPLTLNPIAFAYEFLINYTTYLQYVCIFLNISYNTLLSLNLFAESLNLVNELIINYSSSIIEANPFSSYFLIGTGGLGLCYYLISLLGITNPNFIISVYLFNRLYCWCIDLNNIFG